MEEYLPYARCWLRAANRASKSFRISRTELCDTTWWPRNEASWCSGCNVFPTSCITPRAHTTPTCQSIVSSCLRNQQLEMSFQRCPRHQIQSIRAQMMCRCNGLTSLSCHHNRLSQTRRSYLLKNNLCISDKEYLKFHTCRYQLTNTAMYVAKHSIAYMGRPFPYRKL